MASIQDIRKAPAATDKQLSFIERLLDERDISRGKYTGDELVESRRAQVATFKQVRPTLTKSAASQMIERLLDCPKFPREETKPQVEIDEGMYFLDGVIFKVQRAVHGSGRLYAKRLIADDYGKARFAYAPGIVKVLRPEFKLTKEQAQEWGALYGTCCRCGRTLTAEDSIERMMGPVCFGKMGW